MKRITVFVILAGVLATTRTAPAQDAIGLFFDDQGLTSQITTAAPNELVQAWLVLLDPSQSAGVAGWECEVGIQTDGAQPYVIWEVQGDHINFATPPVFAIGLAAPLPSASVVVLARATVIVPAPEHEISFSIRPYDPPSLLDPPDSGYPVQSPVYVSGENGDLYPLAMATGCVGTPLAHINSDGSDPVTDLTGIPASLYFDSNVVGASAQVNLRVTNPDSVPLFGEASLAMPDAAYRHSGGFYTAEPTTFRVAANGDLVFELTYTLPVVGLTTGEFTLTVCGQQYVVALHGGGEINCLATPTLLDFGDVPVGSVQTSSTTVRNLGDYTIDATPRFVDECLPFTWTSTSSFVDPANLGPGQSMSIEVTYAPLVSDHQYCTLAFGDGICDPVLIEGRALDWPPACEVSPVALDFGSVVQDSTRIRSVVIRNTGGGTLTGEAALVDTAAGFTIVTGGVFALDYNQSHQIDVAFMPTAVGSYGVELDLGTDCESAVLTGEGVAGVVSYIVSPVDFGVRAYGAAYTRAVGIHNTGLVSISGDLQISGDPSFSLADPGPFVVAPGRSWYQNVQWAAAQYGLASAEISTSLPYGETASCAGFGVEIMPGVYNNVGFFFDDAFTQLHVDTDPGTTIPGYLVLKQPWAPVGGWELTMLFAGDAEPLGWTVNGTATGDLGPSEFRVSLASPLPPATTVLLATADILVPSPGMTYVLAGSVADPVIPGYGSYLDGDLAGNHFPLGATRGQTLGTINPIPVAIDAPAAPTVQTAGGEVVLTWFCEFGAVDGYHVYRRFGEGPPERLTVTPVGCDQGRGEFRDRPQVESALMAVYTLTRLIDGVESSPSAAVEISLDGTVPLRTRLLASYPNPFNPQTTVPFELARPDHARLAVYDAAGKLVAVLADAEFGAGRQERVWRGQDMNGKRVPSGVYYLRLETTTNVEVGKILLLK